MKLILTAAVIVASFAAISAQTSNIVTSKCGCESQTIEILKWDFSRDGAIETLTDPSVNNWVEIDYRSNTVRVPWGEKYPMKAVSSAFLPQTTITYSDVVIVITYTPKGEYVSHTVRQR